MNVAELIELLKTCDPNALVVINDEPIIDDDKNIMEGAMMRVESIETGWTYPDMFSDLTFSLRPVGEYLVPAIRLLGHNNQSTDPECNLTINGLAPMKDVPIVPIKRLPSPR